MRKTSWIICAALLAVAGASGCKKKTSGVTDGIKPDRDRMETDVVNSNPTPVTPPLGNEDVTGEDLDGAAKALKDIYFDFDRYEIRADQRTQLEANARWLMANRGTNVIIEGHCDERGTDAYNLALGDKRANVVRSYMETLGVPAGRMSTISYGEAYPVDPRHTEEAWAKNRRAHFTAVPPKLGQGGGR